MIVITAIMIVKPSLPENYLREEVAPAGMKGPHHGNGYGDALVLPLVVVLEIEHTCQ